MDGTAARLVEAADDLRLLFVTGNLCSVLRMRGFRQVSGPRVAIRSPSTGEWRVTLDGGPEVELLEGVERFIEAGHTRSSIVLAAVSDPSWGNVRSWETLPDVGIARPKDERGGGEEKEADAGGGPGDIEVRFSPTGINVSVVREAVEDMRARKIRHVVLVSSDARGTIHSRATAEAAERIRRLSDESGEEHRLEMFDETFFHANIAEHVDTPPHEVLSPGEAQRVLEKLGKPATALPIIEAGDPMSLLLGIQPGQIVRIYFPSPGSGRAPMYFRCK